MIVLRVQYFGGAVNEGSYRKKIILGRWFFIVSATTVAALNLAMIFVENFHSGLYCKISQIVAVLVIFSSSS